MNIFNEFGLSAIEKIICQKAVDFWDTRDMSTLHLVVQNYFTLNKILIHYKMKLALN